MSFCSHCGNKLEPGVRFCANCGATVAVEAEPVYTAAAPAVTAKPVLSGKMKAFGFVGMGLGIGSLVIAVLGVLYTLIFAFAEPAAGFGASVGFGIFSMPMAIVGKMLVGQSMDAGNESAACSVGAKLSLAGLIVTIAMLVIGFIALLAGI